MKSIFKFITVIFFIFSFNASASEFKFRTIGSDKAPVVIYEFISLACSYCKVYNETIFPKLSEEYVKTNKVQVVFVDMPFGSRQNLIAHALLQKTATEAEFKALTILFLNNMDKWKNTENGVSIVKSYAKSFGIPQNIVDGIEDDVDFLASMSNASSQLAKSLNIQGTPTSIIIKRGEKLSPSSKSIVGVPNYEDLKKEIESRL